MFDAFDTLLAPHLRPADIVVGLVVALGCSFVISVLYRWTYQGANYSSTFVRSLIYLSMITAIVMMVIGDNLARAFGLVGAMSIIRFRTAVKDVQDIVFIFLSLAVGLAAGVGSYTVAVIGTAFICTVIAIVGKANYASVSRTAFIVQITYAPAEGEAEPAYQRVLDRYSKHARVVNIRTLDDDTLDLMFFVTPRRRRETAGLIQALQQTPGVQHANLFYDEGHA
ncbi:MAG: DUF4956 domain-containing protein [Bacteroidota bacterium]